ncbi:MAG: CvpA family protein [Bacteroidetes bacterium]|nr:CvpA family protein [Bacteroidota bacterium]
MVIDIIFAIAAGYGFFIGYTKGIIKTVFTILAFGFGLMAAFKFAPAMTNFLETAFNSDNPLMFIAGFLLTFVLTMVFIRLIARGLEGILKTANINIINQIAGGVLLSGMMILLYSVLLWFGDKSHLVNDKTKEDSFTYEYIKDFPTQVWAAAETLKPTFEEFWDHSVDFMDKLEKMSKEGVERSESDAKVYDIEEDN